MRPKLTMTGLAVALAIVMTACSGGGDPEASLQMEQSLFEVQEWKIDNSQVAPVSGKLTLDGKPVTGAAIDVSGKRTVDTDESGEFSIMVDRSVVGKLPLTVKSLDKATIKGKELSKAQSERLMQTSAQLNVVYPIRIQDVSDGESGTVTVKARAVLPDNGHFPVFEPNKYAIYGTVANAEGEPVQGATVIIRRDGVEGFAKSDPTDEKGEYRLYYLPEEDEIYLKVRVGDIDYTLPENKVNYFPEGTSVRTDITLPAEGTVIADYPPYYTSKTAPGVLYKGLLIGVNVPEGVEYTITIPERDGSFELTLPKDAWERQPTFYETMTTRFSLEPLNPGDELPSSALEKPKAYEPDAIVAATAD